MFVFICIVVLFLFLWLLSLLIKEDVESKQNKNRKSTSKGLNYTPLSKSELNSKYETSAKYEKTKSMEQPKENSNDLPHVTNSNTSKPVIRSFFLPADVNGLPAAYCYEDVHICIIKGKEPDMSAVLSYAKNDANVIVEAEPTNPYDHEAVALYTSTRIRLGYLYRSRLKDMAYDYLKRELPICARISDIKENEIYINIAFYAPAKPTLPKEYANQISFTLQSSTNDMQEALEFADEGDELEFDFDFMKCKYVFLNDYQEIGYAPNKYNDILNDIDDYEAKIIKLNELNSGKISAKINLKY